MNRMEPGCVRIKLASDPRMTCLVRGAAEALARRLQFSDKACHQVALAVEEALTNVIRHSYHGQTDRPIEVTLMVLSSPPGEALEIVIEDESEHVDLSKIRSRSLEEIRPGGLGAHLIGQTMDEVEYDMRAGGGGLRLRMRKYKQAAQAAG